MARPKYQTQEGNYMAKDFQYNVEAVAGQLENLLNSDLPYPVTKVADLAGMSRISTIATQAATLQRTLVRAGYSFDPNYKS